ncbi:ARPP-2 domain-containing protein [Thermomonospora catenispora]|uniref:ARPP-2 domain-containing protein n=1 Tax=Thermomonospora catenispora TaxID=2493090 RepID=UPI00111E48DC|nr:hypothetical protein [Thermomonospora catenispora]TNY36825.1 hypothetical protein EIO00_10970 [Thermomonospora catenispora]
MLTLDGLTVRPAQVWGGVRLVPLIRDEPIEGLRLEPELYEEACGVVQVDERTCYASYIPHGFVARWSAEGVSAAYGTQLRGRTERRYLPARMAMRFHRRMARRADTGRLRFLPLHLAMEGYLSLHFGGPEIAWEEWSREALRKGLSPRVEEAYHGAEIRGLEDALRIFEIHHGQCGVLLYIGDALAAAFIVPHPADYRALHPTLLQDMYGELLYHHAVLATAVPDFRAAIDDARVRSLADLRAEAARQHREWAAFHDSAMAAGLLEGEYTVEEVYRMGPFRLSRFLPSFRRDAENHIGEIITDQAGRPAYLKTFRLSRAQVRRGRLLTLLAAHDWRLSAAAEALGVPEHALGMRLEAAGLGALLRRDLLERFRARARR